MLTFTSPFSQLGLSGYSVGLQNVPSLFFAILDCLFQMLELQLEFLRLPVLSLAIVPGQFDGLLESFFQSAFFLYTSHQENEGIPLRTSRPLRPLFLT